MQEETPGRGLTLYALGACLLLFIGLGGFGGLVAEVRGTVQEGQRRVATQGQLTGPYQPGSITLPPASQPSALVAPPAMLAGGAPAPVSPAETPGSDSNPDPYTCTNGRNPYGLECGYEGTQVHVYPPATGAPCLLADGTVSLPHMDARRQMRVSTGTRQWDASRGVWVVTWEQGALFFFDIPACEQ